MLLSDAGVAFTWGDNRYGQLGRTPVLKEEFGRRAKASWAAWRRGLDFGVGHPAGGVGLFWVGFLCGPFGVSFSLGASFAKGCRLTERSMEKKTAWVPCCFGVGLKGHREGKALVLGSNFLGFLRAPERKGHMNTMGQKR